MGWEKQKYYLDQLKIKRENKKQGLNQPKSKQSLNLNQSDRKAIYLKRKDQKILNGVNNEFTFKPELNKHSMMIVKNLSLNSESRCDRLTDKMK